MILIKQQAEAVSNALRALAAVGPDHGAEFQIGYWVYVRRLHLSGEIRIEDRENGGTERHADHAAFSAAYSIA